jgi:outer membrane protein assembly factor BamB
MTREHRNPFAVRALLLSVLAAAAATAYAGGAGEAAAPGADWPRWRGPDANGVSTETYWDAQKLGKLQPAWQASVGQGFSGVSVMGSRVYTMGNSSATDTVWCLDGRTGKKIWSYSYACPIGEYPGPRVTPTVDGDRLVTLSQSGHLLCFDREKGTVLWKKQLGDDLGAGKPTWGFAGSPVVWEELLLLNAGASGIAVRRDTGEKVWGEFGTGGYASVVVLTAEGKTLLAIFGQRAVYAVDPRTGAVAWSYPWVTANDVNAADPLVMGNRMFISSDYGRGCALLEFTATSVAPVWENKEISSHFSSFLFLQGQIFGNDGDANARRGAFVCLDPATGVARWRESFGVGSLLAAGDKLLLLTDRGKLSVGDLSTSGFTETVSAQFPVSVYWTAPVLAHGRLFVRNLKGDLFCVDLRP